MSRFAFTFIPTLLLAFGAAGDSFAQGPPRLGGGPTPPGYSPYLNLLRQGNSPGVNYYGLVRPQQNFANAIQTLQNQPQMGATSPILGGRPDGSDLPATGLTVGYMTHRGYFLNNGSGGVGAGTGRQPARR